ncbi:MAG: alpha/beta fold hydrolase [Desulfonatronovibrio sp.]
MSKKNSSESVEEKPYKNLFISGWAGYRYFFPTISSSFNYVIPFEEKTNSEFEVGIGDSWDIVAAWSFGAHLCLKNLHRIRARKLILIAPFLNFCAYNQKDNILKMISGLDQNPEATLAWFWRLCGIKNKPDMKIKNTDGLKKGLEVISDSRVNLDKLDSSITTIIIHGQRDQIVPMKVSQIIKARMPQASLALVHHSHFIPEQEILKIINYAEPDSQTL